MKYLSFNPANSTILIVDDNLDNLRLLSNMLSKHGYTTRRAISGTLALQSLVVNQFDLILLDINMPDINGYEVCEQLKQDQRFSNIPVIFISALNDVSDKVKGFQIGGSDYITKPFQVEEVLARVENQLQIIDLQKKLYIVNQKLINHNKVLQQSNDRYLKNSLIDPITNFKTRIAFVGQLRQNLKKYERNQNFFAFLILQCDRLKLYQSILMAKVENQCSIYISNKIEKFVTHPSILGRLNETEFAVFIENINLENIDIIIDKISKLQEELKLPFKINQQEFFLNPSCGIVIGDCAYQNPEQILCDARHALLEAQTQGYGNYQIFERSIQIQTLKESKLKLDFIKALTNKSLNIDYQPIISLNSSKIVSLAAKIAWNLNSETKLDLEKIAELAIDTGFIARLNNYLLEGVGERLGKYQKSFLTNSTDNLDSSFKISIYLSTWQFLQSDLPISIAKMISKYQLEPERIEIAISERAFSENKAIAIKNLKNIQQLSISTSIDHLGTYFLTLAKEHNIAIDNLKINNLLLQQITTKRSAKEIYTAAIQTAHSLGMTVTADGIINREQFNCLQELNCEFGQGSWIVKMNKSQLASTSARSTIKS